MISAEFMVVEMLAAIQTHILVAPKEHPVTQGGPAVLAVMQIASTGDNAVQLNLTAGSGETGSATQNGADTFSKGPDDQVACVEGRGFLPSEPLYGVTGNIESEYM